MYIQSIPRTPPLIATFLAKLHKQLVEHMKNAGNAMHNCVVDPDFNAQPETRDSVIQVMADWTPAVTHAEAVTKMNALRPFLLGHLNDGTYAHNAADTTNAAIITAPDATDITTASALLVQYRTALNQHFAATAPHNRIAIVPAISTVPVDEATNIQVLNTILLIYKQHIYSAAISLNVTGV